MFQLLSMRCFNIRRFAIHFNEPFAVRDEFSMKTVREVVFFRLRSDDGSAEPLRTHLSITLVSDGPAGGWLNQQSSVLSVFESGKKHPAIAWLPFVPDLWRGNIQGGAGTAEQQAGGDRRSNGDHRGLRLQRTLQLPDRHRKGGAGLSGLGPAAHPATQIVVFDAHHLVNGVVTTVDPHQRTGLNGHRTLSKGGQGREGR
jgi:hypothetical protein